MYNINKKNKMKLSLVFVGAVFGEQCYEVSLKVGRSDTVEKALSMLMTKFLTKSEPQNVLMTSVRYRSRTQTESLSHFS